MDLFVPVTWTLFSNSVFCCQKTGPNVYGGWIWLLEYYCPNHKYGISYATTLNESHINPTDTVRTGMPFERTRRTTTGSHRFGTNCLNPLKPELNPFCYLLALLGAHHLFHVSRRRVKLLTLRWLMSYIYGAPILDVSRSHTTTQHSR